MARQVQAPNGQYINIDAGGQFQTPGGSYLNEADSGVTLDVGYTEASDTVAVAVTVAITTVDLDIGYTEADDLVAVAVTVAASGVSLDIGYTESSDTVLATVSMAGVLTTRQFQNNTGPSGLRANVANVTLNVYHPTTGDKVVQMTGLTTNASGRLVVSHPSMGLGIDYAYEGDFTAAGFGRRLPVGTAV